MRAAFAVIVILTACSTASAASQTVAVPCDFPHGWNSTDESREVNGIPDGYDHQCLIGSGERIREGRSSSWTAVYPSWIRQ
jgi:hypothetical protein